MHNAKWFFSGIMLLISMVVFSQQLKLGKNPYLLNKSAVLELESANQGLLFTRIADTALINVQTPPDGMVIFHIPSLQLLLRTSGSWKPLTVSSALSNYWSTSGNTATTATNFLGTTDLRHLYFKTNNVQALFIDSAGNAGIGTSPLFTIGNREKFLVDAGITTSFNVISGKGSIDNYLQLNIQNRSAGASASSDVVASADNATESINYVDLGINSSAFTNATYPVLSGLNNAYLYSTGNDFIIGNATAGRNVRFFSGGYANANERMRIDGNGNVGMGVLSPTAYLHIKAGTATAATAPLKFTSGTLLTTTEDGSVEYNGSHFFGTIGTTRYQLDQQTGIISLNGLTTSVQTFATAIAGTTPAWSSVSPTHTLNIPLASTGTTTAGLISNNSFTSFTNKVGAITMPATTLHAALTFTVPAGGAATGVLLLNTQAANKIFAGPVTGVDVVPVFRALVPADLPVATATTTGAISAGSGLLVNGAGVLSTNFSLGSLSATAPLAYNNTTGVISIPKATTAVDGYLSFADWNTFNNKLSSIDTSNIAGFYTKVRSELSGGTGISYITNTGVISNTGVLSLNGLTGPLTMDTGFIGNFSTKVRSLFSTTAPVTYSNGLIGITQANTTTNGYLSSTDWNTFNSKAASYSSGNLTETGSAVLTITGGTNAVLGSGTTVLVKQAGGAQNGFLTSADWTAFNNKLSTVDTTNITSFALKVRSLFSATAPITYSNGLIGINQATTFANGYLSSTDFNTFNNKAGSISLTGTPLFSPTNFTVTAGSATGSLVLNSQSANQIFAGPPSGVAAAPGFRLLTTADLPAGTGTTSNTWTTTGNSGITSGTNFIGTTDIKSFVMRTNNSQGLILDSLGNVGVGFSPLFTASPNREKLLVDAGINAANDYINVVSGKGNTNNYLQVNIQNRSGGTAASSDIVATNNLGSESSNYIDMGINSSGFATGTISGAPNTAYLFATGNDFVIGNSTSGKPLRFYTTASGISANAVLVDSAGKVGIGILTPAEKLDVTGNLKLTGAFMPGGNAGTSGYFLTSNGAGTSPSWSSLSSSQQWALNGNTVTTEKSLGTLSNFDLPFITNSTEKMRISASGNVGIGSAAFDATNPEKLLVDAGTTNSSTLINATGSKNGYLQLNVQNISNGNFASTDIVATANNGTDNSVYIDMGINSQGYTTGNSNLLNGSNTAYLYASAGDFYVGNGATNKPLIFFTNTGIQGDAYANGTENMRIQPGGNVGIGTSAPSQKLTVNGNIGASAYVTNSDKRLKTNIQNLSYGLKEVLALQPVKYNWRKTPNGDKQIGLIAQDVRKVIPEVVVGDATKEKLGLNYTELVPVLINAIKEQQKQIDDLKQQILKLQK